MSDSALPSYMERIEMLRGPFVCLAVVALSMFLSATTATAQGRANPAQDRAAVDNGWQFDYQAAKSLARRTNKPLMVVFRCVP
jgi:hypothetical protein